MAADDVFVCGLVGEWVARLHGFGREHLDALKPTFTNTPARNIVGGVFESVSAKFLKHTDFEDKQEVAACIDAFYQGQADKPAKPSDHDRTLLFGDLWSGSVLFNESTRAVNLLDFEFADIGKVHGDIGHFVAHILPLYFVSNKDYDPNTDPCPPNVREFLLAYKRTLLAEYPDVYRAVIEDAVQKSASLFAIELTGEVLSGKWCRCGKESTEKHAPLKCKCGDTLLRFTRPYIKGSTETIFNLLK
ncbi:hypothetical protein GGI12_005318 [Dipsacomyces acuminosporus]|nr:hypothetical protein GGI12_005318 [Dipsacomyces acuminosporus]